MIRGNEHQTQQDNWRRQLAGALGVDIQRLHVFFSLYENAFVQDALPSKIKHLIAMAMAIGERTSESIAYHVNEALLAGASRSEIRETVTVAVFTAGIPSLSSGLEALACMAQYEARQMLSAGGTPVNGIRG